MIDDPYAKLFPVPREHRGDQVRRMLDISTGHLPKSLGDSTSHERLSVWPGVRAFEIDHGWLMWVPDDPTSTAAACEEDEFPIEVLAIQIYARSLGCDWVMFDSDGWFNDGLPSYDW